MQWPPSLKWLLAGHEDTWAIRFPPRTMKTRGWEVDTVNSGGKQDKKIETERKKERWRTGWKKNYKRVNRPKTIWQENKRRSSALTKREWKGGIGSLLWRRLRSRGCWGLLKYYRDRGRVRRLLRERDGRVWIMSLACHGGLKKTKKWREINREGAGREKIEIYGLPLFGFIFFLEFFFFLSFFLRSCCLSEQPFCLRDKYSYTANSVGEEIYIFFF